MRRIGRTGALVLIAGVVGLAIGLPLGAVLFDGGSDSRRSGSLSVLGPVVLSTTCEKRYLNFNGLTVVHTSATSRFRLPGTGTVQARMIFYRDGAVMSVEPWEPGTYTATDGTYSHGGSLLDDGPSPDRVRAEWLVGKQIYPMFQSC